MNVLAKRNLKIFFRDKSNVFFSFLAVFIILGLYVIFLGDLMKKSFTQLTHVDFVVDSWVMAGILAVTSITATLGAFGIMVGDRSSRIIKDFAAAPVSKNSIAAGYIISVIVIGLIMSVITFGFAELYIYLKGGELLSFISALQVLGLIVLSVLASSSIIFFISSFISSQNAFSTVGTIVGTLIGFLTGIYIPIGSLPEAVQFLIKIFPVSHAAALFRQVMLERPMELSFSGADEQAVNSFQLDMGVHYQFGSFSTNTVMSITYLLITMVVFYLLALMNIARKNK
ncbi:MULTISPECIES: ABC transporter permease [unclassified Paenibacillus]|uniref:ABC transporter permease n=1 Tax=unclassified Paenibacillus TaxID=185978 RepID=UPI002F3F90F2